MSNEVLPRLPGQTLKQSRSPRWKTDLRETGSGRVFSRARWATGRRDLKLEYEFLRSGTEGELQQLEGFFNRHRGNAESWLFDDENDRTVVREPFGVGSGATASFQLVRSRGDFIDPVYELHGEPTVYFAGNPAGINRVLNGSFQAGSPVATAWSAYQGGAVGSVSYNVLPGGVSGNCQGIVASALGASAVDRIGVSQSINVASLAGKQVCLSAKLFESTAACDGRIYVDVYDASDTFIGTNNSSPIALGNFWTEVQLTMTLLSNAHHLRMYVWVENATGGPSAITAYIDNAQLVPGATPSDFIASEQRWTLGANGLITFQTPPSPGVELTWSGDYYWRCRFKRSDIEFEQFMHELWSLKQLEFSTEKP